MDSSDHRNALSKIFSNPYDLHLRLNEFSVKRIVLVKGVYDIFHSGHYYSFIAAKALGDILVVGVNTDRAVRIRKGSNRPIIDQGNRVILIAALSCVDFITLYEDISPFELIRILKPHVFAASHFDTLTPSQISVLSTHTLFHKLPKTMGISTTQILQRIKGDAQHEKD